jgi:hypothetical protein
VAAELDSEREAAPAADLQADWASVPPARPVRDSVADSEERAEVPVADPAADSQEELVLVPMVRPVGDLGADSADPVVDSQGGAAERAAAPAALPAAAALVLEFWVPAANPSAESPEDLAAGPAVDWSGGRTTVQLKLWQR